MANANIGHITCPITNKLCVVRKDCRGKLYFYSEAGKITPNLITGQIWMQKAFTEWAAPEQPPEDVTLRIIAAGAPPVLELNGTKKALTPAPAIVQTQNPPAVVTKAPEKKRSFLHDFMMGDD